MYLKFAGGDIFIILHKNTSLLKPVVFLIIDDDVEDVELFCEAANEVSDHIYCLSASDGLEGLQILQDKNQAQPDFIFLDLNMPRLSGKQFLQMYQKTTPNYTIPVIVYSTSKLQADIEETKRLGATCFLTKPSKLRDLKDAISFILAGEWEKISSGHLVKN